MGTSIGILFLMPALDRGNFYLVWVIQIIVRVLFSTDAWVFFCGLCGLVFAGFSLRTNILLLGLALYCSAFSFNKKWVYKN
jgi:hypothetical protein